MAIYFESKDAANEKLLIGGQGTYAGVQGGGIGPFPRYSISREELTTGDGTYLNSKFTISINGTAVLKPDYEQKMTVRGQRQERVQGEAIIKFQFNRNKWPMTGAGRLRIEAYGGANASDIVFNDARLVSLEIPEQNEGAGIQNLEYSFVFEAYDDDSLTSNVGTNTIKEPTYHLSTASESWEVASSDQVLAGGAKTFTVTHTLSANGLRKFKTSAGTGVYASGSWEQAKSWCGARAANTPPAEIATDLAGNTMPGFDPDLGFTLTSFCNHARTVSSDIGEGSYGITDTWVGSNGGSPYTLDIDQSTENSQEATSNIYTVTVTSTGLESTAATAGSSDKYANAQAGISAAGADALATALGGTNKMSDSRSDNEETGVITHTVTYNDLTTRISGAISEELTVSYSGQDDVFAVIGVIQRAAGPIIQNMGTKTERKESVSYDVVMGRDSRGSKPSGESIALGAIAGGGLVESKSESWNANTGAYNISITKVYG